MLHKMYVDKGLQMTRKMRERKEKKWEEKNVWPVNSYNT